MPAKWLGFVVLLFGAIGVAQSVVGIALAEPPGQIMPESVDKQPGGDTNGAEQPSGPPLPDQTQQRTQASNYQNPCDQPKDTEEADLCQQWRMAEATDDLVELTARQLWFTTIEMVFIFAAVCFAGWSAFAAASAAKAAVESNRLNREALILSQRA